MWSRDSSKQEMSSSSSSSDSSSSSPSSSLEIIPENQIPAQPPLVHEICLADSKSLSNFLKLSRQNVDDKLKVRLNSLLNHHETTSSPSILPFKRPKSSEESPCVPFIKSILFAQWSLRVSSIEFCVKESEQMLHNIKIAEETSLSDEQRNIMLRQDPYGMRDIEKKLRNSRAEAEEIHDRFANERYVERIVQTGSSQLIEDLCKLNEFDVKKEFDNYMKAISK